ncbi:hypothetical protein C7460_104136 [Marinoscillum furvescens DSM 4134]|uniref:Uncharacterized protein n=1 Tax=Marinoscillum furvescens DSM 4134 TaxID=1122208 RepID=A0A3D9L602_MARFU|nr:hypothetical protein C7460_104136 [Marinoscillum furvescens DSM 4134]
MNSIFVTFQCVGAGARTGSNVSPPKIYSPLRINHVANVTIVLQKCNAILLKVI